ncbi:MAG TPA: single-stranded DNA-binding protein [Acidimicrobiales bacterium]|nr:single-stranded DNA-binding protein [Acidimicrobiales bacterium]
MLKVTVSSPEVRTRSGISKAKNKPYTMHSQTVYFHTLGRDGKPNAYPDKGEILLDTDEHGNPKPYAPGEYQLHPTSFYVGDYGSLAVSPRLVPLAR